MNLCLIVAVAVLCSGANSAAIDPGVLARNPAFLARHLPDAVASQRVLALSALDDAQRLTLAINLPTRNQAELNQLLQDLYDPQSPKYRKYLSVEEFTARFGPTQDDYDTVVAWARASGLEVTGTTPNRRLINVEGNVQAVNRAFNVSMNEYQHPTEERTFFSADREPMINGLDVPLLQISGLNNYVLPHPKLRKSGSPVAHAGGSGPSGEFLPSDMRAAYYGSGALTGSGQSIAILSFDGYLASDVSLYYSSTGMSSSVPINNVLVNGYSGACVSFNSNGTINTSVCDDGEQILDIVNSIGMAPGISQILFYEVNPASASGDTQMLNRMATDNLAKVISCSWGWGVNGAADDAIFQQMATQGQTFLDATGDNGAFSGSTNYEYPSVSAYILQVGGTDLTTISPGGAWSAETGWVDSSGGFESGTPIPSWQNILGVINASNKASSTLRNVPDVAMEANFDNPTVSNGQFLLGYGGTSFAAPRWAGFVALINQQAAANGGGPVGFFNPTLYTVGVGASYSSNFHDIVSGASQGTNPSTGRNIAGATYPSVAGYDLVTGWGSPKAAFITTLAGGSTAVADFSLSAAPTSVSASSASPGSTTITVSPTNGFNSSVSLSASGLPPGVSAAFSPTSTATSSTLTFTVDASNTVGTNTVTITGTSGSLSHSTSVSLTISNTVAPDFSLSAAPQNRSVVQGASSTSTITVSPVGGFSSGVSLAASGLPTGVTASFSPNPATSTSILTLTASGTASIGGATVTVTGTSGSLVRTTPVGLTVVNASSGYVPLVPARVLDTRPGAVTSDGQFAGIGALNAGGTLNLTVLNRGGVPAAGVSAVVLNITVTNPTSAGYVTVWPAGSTLPKASNLNFVPGQTIPNLVIAEVGSNGQVALFNSAGSTDLIADVVGYFTSASALTSQVPARVLDTRTGTTTIDGQFAGIGAIGGGNKLDLTLSGRGGLPASGVGAVIVNVTATNPTTTGFISVWPSASARPLASNLNFVPGQTIPNLVISAVSSAGQISLYNSSGSTDLIADVMGWFPTTSELTSLVPARLMDTRAGATTVDGQFAGVGAVAAQSSLNLIVGGRGGVPASGVGAVVLNVTATNPTAAGFVTVWPTGSARPNASNLNVVPGQTIANLVIAKVGSNGQVSVFNSAGSTDFIADVVGWFPTAP